MIPLTMPVKRHPRVAWIQISGVLSSSLFLRGVSGREIVGAPLRNLSRDGYPIAETELPQFPGQP